MESALRRWSAALTAVLWFIFFVALIFRPDLVVRHPVLGAVAIGGTIWWAVKARRTRHRERNERGDPQGRG